MNLVEFIKKFDISSLTGLVELQDSENKSLVKLSWSEVSSLDLKNKVVVTSTTNPAERRRKLRTVNSASNLGDHASYFYKVFGKTASEFLSLGVAEQQSLYLGRAKSVGIVPLSNEENTLNFLQKYCRMIVFFEPFSYGESVKFFVVDP